MEIEKLLQNLWLRRFRDVACFLGVLPALGFLVFGLPGYNPVLLTWVYYCLGCLLLAALYRKPLYIAIYLYQLVYAIPGLAGIANVSFLKALGF